ncbi:hypothetical protein OH77DRAFT_752757 [Trametes cingulata]|nr:hypothetical protein OH77DRAFT_752757 [Trametes cingulata]
MAKPVALPMGSLTSVLLALALIPSISLQVLAQTSNATCFPTYDWMRNMHGQSPCTVASFLLSPCTSTPSAAFIPPLNNSRSLYNFAGTALDSTPCVCSTVTFAMLYACATCQGAEVSILPWYIVSENCTNAYLESYPKEIPPGTSVPAWAYDDEISLTGRLDIHSAKLDAEREEPDETLSGFYGNLPPTSTYVPPPDPEPYGLFDSTDGPSTGVVVGAAVGGSVGTILLVTVVILVVHRSRRRRLCTADGPELPPKGGRGSIEKAGGESTIKLYVRTSQRHASSACSLVVCVWTPGIPTILRPTRSLLLPRGCWSKATPCHRGTTPMSSRTAKHTSKTRRQAPTRGVRRCSSVTICRISRFPTLVNRRCPVMVGKCVNESGFEFDLQRRSSSNEWSPFLRPRCTSVLDTTDVRTNMYSLALLGSAYVDSAFARRDANIAWRLLSCRRTGRIDGSAPTRCMHS